MLDLKAKTRARIRKLFPLLSIVAFTTAMASSQTIVTLHSFTDGVDGGTPSDSLILDRFGNLYGTTAIGGIYGGGTVFKLTPSGDETVLYSFRGSGDANFPVGGVIADQFGNLYGSTAEGGGFGGGTVYKLTPSGAESILHSFGNGIDGRDLLGSLVADNVGNLYGTTYEGGAYGGGTVFEVTASGDETILHSFGSGEDGAGPLDGLIVDTSGNLYGTTAGGGAHGDGSVFQITPSGEEKVLYSFKGGEDGIGPRATLLADSSGNLYGTTQFGGTYGIGTVFKLTPSGIETVLYSFQGGPSDGGWPYGGVVADASGNLFGTTFIGGKYYAGTVFKLTPSGVETVLHSFMSSDGSFPEAGLIGDAYGNLFGTTLVGGASSFGTVFALSTTPQGEIQLIMNQVNSLYIEGVLNAGQDNSLLMQLSNATRLITAGKINGAIGNLESFISEVNDLSNSSILSTAQATSLIRAATNEIAQVQNM